MRIANAMLIANAYSVIVNTSYCLCLLPMICLLLMLIANTYIKYQCYIMTSKMVCIMNAFLIHPGGINEGRFNVCNYTSPDDLFLGV